MSAQILVHPGFSFNPFDIARLERETGLKCRRDGALVVRLVPANQELKNNDQRNDYQPEAA